MSLALSVGLRYAWKNAAYEAVKKRSETIESIHIILGALNFDKVVFKNNEGPESQLFEMEKKIFFDILSGQNINVNELGMAIRNVLPSGNAHYPDNIIHRSEDCKNQFSEARRFSGSVITSMSFFAAEICREKSVIREILNKKNIHIDELIHHLTDPSLTVNYIDNPRIPAKMDKYKFLSTFGVEMVNQAGQMKFKSFEGREKEINQMVTTLGKYEKHNIILIGEPGVGKTALVEGLAQLIHKGERCKDRKIFNISAAMLIAGTKYRGDLEERLKNIIEEATNFKEVIVFFDEIHQLIGAGGTDSGMDAANILKPALTRGDFTCIGATTISEYRKYIEKDSAFSRRFQPIMINEPSAEETIKILHRLKADLQAHHEVTILDDAIQASVELSVRYLPDRCLPDKAKDLLDETCSAVSHKTVTIISDNNSTPRHTHVYPPVDHHIVCKVISRLTGINVMNVSEVDAERALRLNIDLKKKILGQDLVIDGITEHINMSLAGMGDPKRPVGVFLFIGPTGVGKTYLAEILAEKMFDSDSFFVRYDMSEFKDSFTSSKLIGSPPGYIGSDEEGMLIRHLRTRPYSVVLFDEIDKAHQDILDLLLNLFDAGRITDNRGRFINGKNAIFIMTSNFKALKLPPIGFNREEKESTQNIIKDYLQNKYRHEFLNRINKILFFNNLGMNELKSIVEMKLMELFSQIKKTYNLTTDEGSGIKEFICDKCIDTSNGAREISRIIDQHLKAPISNFYLKNKAKIDAHARGILKIELINDEIKIKLV